MAEPFHVDVAQLNAYLAKTQPSDTIPSPLQLLGTAYNALLAAGVVKLYDRPVTLTAPIKVGADGVTMQWERKSWYWSPDRVPPVAGAIAPVAHHLIAVMNQEPTPGPWPKQLD